MIMDCKMYILQVPDVPLRLCNPLELGKSTNPHITFGPTWQRVKIKSLGHVIYTFYMCEECKINVIHNVAANLLNPWSNYVVFVKSEHWAGL